MLNSLTYCEKCIDELESYGGIAVLTFEKLCEEYVTIGPFDLSDDPRDMPFSCLAVVKFLEKKGYIISTESSEFGIQIKPSCIEMTDDGFHFCKCKL
jgi:hypothetical protein